MMADEDDNKSQDGIWGKWQTIVAILTLCAAVLEGIALIVVPGIAGTALANAR
jgi:hypothetical protein